MAVSQELLSAVSNIQPNAQAGLPVMPNNGNPGGVYNMPAQVTQEANAAPTVKPGYEWLLPDPSLARVDELLNIQQQMLQMPPPNISDKYNTVVRDGEFVDEMLDSSGLPLLIDPVNAAQASPAVLPQAVPQAPSAVLPARAY